MTFSSLETWASRHCSSLRREHSRWLQVFACWHQTPEFQRQALIPHISHSSGASMHAPPFWQGLSGAIWQVKFTSVSLLLWLVKLQLSSAWWSWQTQDLGSVVSCSASNSKCPLPSCPFPSWNTTAQHMGSLKNPAFQGQLNRFCVEALHQRVLTWLSGRQDISDSGKFNYPNITRVKGSVHWRETNWGQRDGTTSDKEGPYLTCSWPGFVSWYCI